MHRRWAFLALLLLAAPVASNAQLVTGSVRGQVDGGSSQDFVVVIPALGMRTHVDERGEFRFDGVPQGSYDIVLRTAAGEQTAASREHIIAGRTHNVRLRADGEIDAAAPPLMPAARHGLVVDGRMLRELPLDGAGDLLGFVPGVQRLPQDAFHRDGVPANTALYIDGISAQSLRTGATGQLRIGEAALSQWATTTGVAPAWLGGSTSRVTELSTARGGEEWRGEVRVQTAGLAPESWRRSENRGWFAAGGPVPGVGGLRLHVTAAAHGRGDADLPRGLNDVPVYVASGLDTTFTLARNPITPGSAPDSLQVAVPRFERLARSTTAQLGQSDAYTLGSRLSWSGAGGARVDATFHHSRDQMIRRGLAQLYNPEGWRGRHDSGTRFALQGHVPLSATLGLNLQAAHDRDWSQQGAVRAGSAAERLDARFGFSRADLDFHMDADEWTVTEQVLRDWRESRTWGRRTFEEPWRMMLRQAVLFVPGSLRLNPYGFAGEFPISGLPTAGTGGESWGEEKRVSLGASVEWRPTSAHSGALGLEFARADTRELNIDLLEGFPNDIALNEPQLASLFAQHRIEGSRFSIEGGVRIDRFDPDAEVQVVPGFAGSPDLPDTGWRPAQSRTVASPRLAAEFAGPICISLHAAFSEAPRFPAVSGPGGIALRTYADGYLTGFTNVTWGQDVSPTRGRLVEVGAGRRHAYGISADLRLYHLTVLDPLEERRELFRSPVTGTDALIRVLANGAKQTSKGVDATVSGQVLDLLSGSLTYGYTDQESARPHSLGALLSLLPGRFARGSRLGTALDGTAVHAVAQVTSGLPYTRLSNTGEGSLTSSRQFAGTPAEQLNGSRLPAMKRFDLRLTHQVPVSRVRVQAFADVRNVLGFTNTHALFAETGTLDNEVHREREIARRIFDLGGGTFGDIDIRTRSGNDLNRHMLLRAEERFGDGDAIFTVAEQRVAAGAWYDLVFGPQWLQDTGRTLRLGLQLNF